MMTDFVVTIIDEAQLAGITWAREQHDAALPPPTDPPDPAAEAPLETDEAYVQWVMEQAAVSYAQQKSDAAWRAAQETSQQRGEQLPTAETRPDVR